MKVTDKDREAAKLAVNEWDDFGGDCVARAIAQAREEGRREEREACIAAIAHLLRGPQPPSWSADLHDCCELKEDAYDAGYCSGEWAATRDALNAIRTRGED